MHSELFTLLTSWILMLNVDNDLDVFLCQIHSFWVRISYGKFFSSMALYDVMKGGTPCMGIYPRRVHTHRPERE